jgi:hypothetical protein
MFKNPKFSSTETSSFNTLYRQLSFQKLFALELHKTSKNCKNCWAVFQAAINSAAIFNLFNFIKLVDRGECKIIGTRLTMFSRRIVEFLHKRTRRICSLLAFGELASSGFFHCIYVQYLYRVWNKRMPNCSWSCCA